MGYDEYDSCFSFLKLIRTELTNNMCVWEGGGGGNLCECIWGETSECGGVGVV